MDLSQLNMFKIVAEQGSIVQASKLLHCVPSNITARIKLLEAELGSALFLRRGRGLVITPAGVIFLGYVDKILTLCLDARRALEPESPPSGVLKIGAVESAATGRLPGLMAKFDQDYPLVDLRLRTDTWVQLEVDVATHKLDGAVIACFSSHPGVECLEVYQERLVLITPEDIEAIGSPHEFAGMKLLAWPEGCPYRRSLEHWLNARSVSMPIRDIASYGTILGCVSAGMGISLVPHGMFERFKKIGNIAGHTIPGLAPVSSYFIWSKQVSQHPAREAFIQLLINEFQVVA